MYTIYIRKQKQTDSQDILEEEEQEEGGRVRIGREKGTLILPDIKANWNYSR